MWTIYKKLLVEDGISRRDQVLAQGAFYSGARCVLKVFDRMAVHGDVEELHRTIGRFGRQLKTIRA